MKRQWRVFIKTKHYLHQNLLPNYSNGEELHLLNRDKNNLVGNITLKDILIPVPS